MSDKQLLGYIVSYSAGVHTRCEQRVPLNDFRAKMGSSFYQ